VRKTKSYACVAQQAAIDFVTTNKNDTYVGSADSIPSSFQQDLLPYNLSLEAYVLVTCRKIVERNDIGV